MIDDKVKEKVDEVIIYICDEILEFGYDSDVDNLVKLLEARNNLITKEAVKDLIPNFNI